MQAQIFINKTEESEDTIDNTYGNMTNITDEMPIPVNISSHGGDITE